MEDKLVSVIIPAFNAEKTLERAVTSVLKQSLSELVEIIIVDDGSNDDTLSVAKRLKDNNANVIYYTQVNSGVGGARNTGIEHATGQYIAFLDADDSWESSFLDNILIETIKNEMADIYAFSFKSITASGLWEKTFNYPEEHIYFDDTISDRYYCGSVWRHLFRTDLIKDNSIRFSSAKIGEDLVFTEECGFLSRHIHVISKVMYLYIKNTNSVMHSTKAETYIKSIVLQDERQKWYADRGVDKSNDCDYQRILLQIKIIHNLCVELNYNAVWKLIKEDSRFKLLMSFEDGIVSLPMRCRKDLVLWKNHPRAFYLKNKLLRLPAKKITQICYNNYFLNAVLESIVYRIRGYIKVRKK